MKKIILLLAIFSSVKSFAQTDSSKLTITLTFKQKHVAFMGYELSLQNTLADAKYRDSLVKYIGSGSNPDSLVTVILPAGIILNFIQNLFNQQAGTTYSTIYEVGNGASGFTGLLAQLFVKASGGSEVGIAKWLFLQISNLLSAGTFQMNQQIYYGTYWLKNPITYK